jgi:putative peptidoglycan lipid II flippase
VYQISSVVDTMLASTLEQGAVAILGYAQLLAMLPVSLFGVSVAAAALPELARDVATADVAVLRERLADGARRVAYFAIPAAAALAALSTEVLGALFQTGRFGPSETVIAASVLAAYAIAIPAQASVKLFASGHYAFGDTRTPVAIAAASVAASAGSAFLLMQRLGPAGIGLGAAVGGWLNVVLNAGMLSRRTGRILDGPHRRHIAAGAVAIVPATLIALGISRLAGDLPRVVAGVAALGGFGLAYGVTTLTFRHPEAVRIAERVRSNLPRRS